MVFVLNNQDIIGWPLARLHGNLTPPTVCRSPTHCLRRF